MKTTTLKELVEPLFATPKKEDVDEGKGLKIQSSIPTSTSGKLGLDLPDNEDDLFTINHHLLFDITLGITLFGSEETARNLHKDFKKNSIEKDLGSIKQSHESEDWKQIEKLSHKMKGSACYGTVRHILCTSLFGKVFKGRARKMC